MQNQPLDIEGEARQILDLAECEWKHSTTNRVLAVGFATLGRLLGAILLAVSKDQPTAKGSKKS